jgi:hypothetical protein
MRPDDDYDEDNEYEADEAYELLQECGLSPNGQCSMAGTEHCDFICPLRRSEYFAGSKAWNEKHRRKRKVTT